MIICVYCVGNITILKATSLTKSTMLGTVIISMMGLFYRQRFIGLQRGKPSLYWPGNTDDDAFNIRVLRVPALPKQALLGVDFGVLLLSTR